MDTDQLFRDSARDTESTGLHKLLGGALNWWNKSEPEDEEYDGMTTQPIEMPAGEFGEDEEIGDTLNLIQRVERRWMDDGETRDIVAEAPEDVEQLLTRLERNNQLLLDMLENFDSATFKTDYRSVKAENKELVQKYYKLRKDYRQEVQGTKQIHERYCSLVKRYQQVVDEDGKKAAEAKRKLKAKDERIAELQQQQRKSDKMLKEAEMARDRAERKNRAVAEYRDKYEDLHVKYLTRANEENDLRARVKELEMELEGKRREEQERRAQEDREREDGEKRQKMERIDEERDSFEILRRGSPTGPQSPRSSRLPLNPSSPRVSPTNAHLFSPRLPHSSSPRMTRNPQSPRISQSPFRSTPATPTRTNGSRIISPSRYFPVLDEDTMNTVELLRRKYADKTYDEEDLTEIDTHISKPTVDLLK